MGPAPGPGRRSDTWDGRLPRLGSGCRLDRRLRRDQETPQGLDSIQGFLRTPQPAADSADASFAVSAEPLDLAVISRPFLFMSNLCFRSSPLTNPRDALATAPGRLEASTFTVDSTVASLRS